jgi:hypothetical protein
VGGGHEREIGLQVEAQTRTALFGETIGFGEIGAVIDPKDGDARVLLRGEMQNDGLIRTEVRGDDGLPVGLRESRLDDLLGRFAAGFVIEGRIWSGFMRGATYSPYSRCVK